MDVPKNTKVHFEYSKEGHELFSTEVIADQQQAVNAVLKSLAGAQASDDAEKPAEPKKHPPKKKAVDAPTQKDGLIDLGDDIK